MIHGIDLFFALFNNLAIFIALIAIYSYLLDQLKQSNWYKRQIVLGLSFGIFAIGCMYAKIPVFAGVIVDQRNAIIALSGAFGGPVSAILSAILAGSFRVYLGGDGALAGVIGVSLAATAGIGLNKFSKRFSSIRIATISALVASIIILPGFLFVDDIQTGWELMKAMTIPYGSAIFLAIFMGGLLLRREEDRYQAELLFRETEQKYRELVEGTVDLITHINKHKEFTFVNHIAERVLGFSAKTCIGMPAFQFVHPDDHERTVDWFNKCVAQKTKQAQIENRQVNAKTGEVYTVSWSSSFHFDNSGNLVGVGSIVRDITKRKQAEISLRESETRYRTLFEYVPDGILIANMESYYLDANPMMCKMLGYTHEELIGLHTSDIVAPHEVQHIQPALDKIKASFDYFRIWQFQRKDGSLFSAEVTVTTMPNNTLLAMVHDITERIELESQLLQAQKMDSIGQLAGGIAHDFNNILVPIIGYTELAMMNLTPNNKLYAALQQIHKAGNRAASLTQQILAFSRKQVLEMRVLDLNEIVTDFKKMIQRLIGEDIELQTFLTPALYQVKADKSKIEQVLLNLAVNARDAMPTGGKLIIETGNVYLDETYVKKYAAAQPPGPYVMLAITDTGCGMDAEIQQQIFEPFFTTKTQGKGTGLGLSTVFGIIKQHGGNIWVYSEPGQGATFKIYLPQADGIVEISDNLAIEPVSLYGTETVLVAEDEEMVRKMVCETLAAHGYQVIEAQNVADGLQRAAETKQTIHLLLTDVIMPEMNGREFHQKVLAFHPEIQVLYMSGYTDNVIVHHGILEEGVNFLQKPFAVQNLVRKVRQVLG
ncbi:MAG: PAS domain S-box protein [Anaerolineales bacterium]|nr:PAS domain S-box protein [Anaerolineales bacterium]